MKVKNILSYPITFNAGKRTYNLDESGGDVDEITVGDDIETLNEVIDHVRKGRLEIVTAPPSAQYSATPQRYGYADIKLGASLADEDEITIGSVVFEIDEAADGPASVATNVAVTAADASDNGVTADGLKAAINANATLQALGVECDDVVKLGLDDARVIVKAKGDTAIADLTVTGDNCTVTKVNAADSVGYRTSVVKVVATATTELIDTGLTSIDTYSIQLFDSAGAVKLYDGTVTTGDGFIYLSDGGGTVYVAATDVVIVTATGK